MGTCGYLMSPACVLVSCLTLEDTVPRDSEDILNSPTLDSPEGGLVHRLSRGWMDSAGPQQEDQKQIASTV